MRRHPRPRVEALAAMLALALAALPAGAVRVVELKTVPIAERISASLAAGDLVKAEALIDEQLRRTPRDPSLLYNAACLRCRMGKHDPAAQHLLEAIRWGYSDFNHLRRDSDLAPLHGHPAYRAIIDARAMADTMLGGFALKYWQDRFGDEHYEYVTDDSLKLHFAWPIDEAAQFQARLMLASQARLQMQLFESLQANYVLIAVPRTEDLRAVLAKDHAHGVYQHSRRRLVAGDLGRSLRHEYTHVLHHGHMDALQQDHPMWIQEGLACLFENYEFVGDRGMRVLPNDRDVIVRHLAQRGRLMPWHELMGLSDSKFGAEAARTYPQARSMFEFLHEKGLLDAWYAGFVRGFDDDRSGAAALERVFGKPLEQIEADWRDWLASRPVEIQADHRGLQSTDDSVDDDTHTADDE